MIELREKLIGHFIRNDPISKSCDRMRSKAKEFIFTSNVNRGKRFVLVCHSDCGTAVGGVLTGLSPSKIVGAGNELLRGIFFLFWEPLCESHSWHRVSLLMKRITLWLQFTCLIMAISRKSAISQTLIISDWFNEFSVL